MKVTVLASLILSVSSISHAEIKTVIKTTYLNREGNVIEETSKFVDSLFDDRTKTYCYESDVYDACRALANDIHEVRENFADGGDENLLLKKCEIKGVTIRAKYIIIDSRGNRPVEKSISIPPCSGI